MKWPALMLLRVIRLLDFKVDPQKLFDIRRSILFLSPFFRSCIFHPQQVCTTFSSSAFSPSPPCRLVLHFHVLHFHVVHFQRPHLQFVLKQNHYKSVMHLLLIVFVLILCVDELEWRIERATATCVTRLLNVLLRVASTSPPAFVLEEDILSIYMF